MYLYTASIKGVSPVRLHRELGISRKAARFLMHRLRKASETGEALFADPVEADEARVKGKAQEQAQCRAQEVHPVDITAVAGGKGRETNKVVAKVVERTDKETSRGLVEGQVQEEATNHSISECVWNVAYTNGMESFMAMLKRGHDGIHRKMSPEHLGKHVYRFANRRDIREKGPVNRMGGMASGARS